MPDREGEEHPNSRKILGRDKELFDQYDYIRRLPGELPLCSQVGACHLDEAARDPMLRLDTFAYNGCSAPSNIEPLRSVVSVSLLPSQ